MRARRLLNRPKDVCAFVITYVVVSICLQKGRKRIYVVYLTRKGEQGRTWCVPRSKTWKALAFGSFGKRECSGCESNIEERRSGSNYE